MDTIDASGRQSASLPPINHFNMDRIKREENDAQRAKVVPPMGPPTQHAPYAGNSSHTQGPATSGLASLSGILSPQEPQRPNTEDSRRGPAERLSLPSIHEALNAEQPLPPPPTSAPTPTSHASHPQSHHAPSTSPADSIPRGFNPELTNKGPPYPTSQSTYAPGAPHTNGVSSVTGTPESAHRNLYSSVPPSNGKLPSLHPLKTMDSPMSAHRPLHSQPYGQQTSPHAEPGSRSAGNAPYGYVSANQAPGYPYSAPPHNAPPPYGPPSTFSPPRYANSWRPDDANRVEQSKRNGRLINAPYGESVKRHLDNFDLEASLNEIADGSGRILDFTRNYGRTAHHSARQGLILSAMPSTEEINEQLKHNARIMESLNRMREVVEAQQKAIAEQGKDLYHKQSNGYDQHDDSGGYADDSKSVGGFGGPDAKKRRGRAAPPGRCHSCNRAETPEWRRGPDGARTLCNACGLHYAKLTRKMGSSKVQGGSNLRPKSMGPGSPPA